MSLCFAKRTLIESFLSLFIIFYKTTLIFCNNVDRDLVNQLKPLHKAVMIILNTTDNRTKIFTSTTVYSNASGNNSTLLKNNIKKITDHFNHLTGNNEKYQKIMKKKLYEKWFKDDSQYAIQNKDLFTNINATVFKLYNGIDNKSMNKSRIMFNLVKNNKMFPSNQYIRDTMLFYKPKSGRHFCNPKTW